jgi:hypothetical protein
MEPKTKLCKQEIRDIARGMGVNNDQEAWQGYREDASLRISGVMR